MKKIPGPISHHDERTGLIGAAVAVACTLSDQVRDEALALWRNGVPMRHDDVVTPDHGTEEEK